MEKTASEAPPAAASTVPARADVAAARLRAEYERGASTVQLAEKYGWSASTIKKRILDGGGTMRAPVEGLHLRRAHDLEQYKRRHRLLDRAGVERATGLSSSTVVAHADQLASEGLALRYAGDGWNAAVDRWLFRRPAPDRLLELVAEGDRRRAKADGRTGRPRTGRWRECECGCGRKFYEQNARPRRFHSLTCKARRLWPPSLEMIGDHWPAASRRRARGAFDGRRGGGRPPIALTDQQKGDVRDLASSGWGERSIAKRLGLSRRAVRLALGRRIF
jgi:hypothetical protein